MKDEKGVFIPLKYIYSLFVVIIVIGGVVYNIKDNSARIADIKQRQHKKIELLNELKEEVDRMKVQYWQSRVQEQKEMFEYYKKQRDIDEKQNLKINEKIRISKAK